MPHIDSEFYMIELNGTCYVADQAGNRHLATRAEIQFWRQLRAERERVEALVAELDNARYHAAQLENTAARLAGEA